MKTIPSVLRFLPIATTVFAGDPSAIAQSVVPAAPPGNAGAIDEETQARYLTRAMAIAFAKGVERYFWYEFRAPEDDPYYSEDHFGMTHADMSPKPAFDAYRAFVARRPPGSVQRSVPLRDPATGVWRSEWTRPDGTVAGVFWAPGDIEAPVFYEGAALAR